MASKIKIQDIGPKNSEEQKIFFIEGTRIRLQNKICQRFNEKGLSREQVQASLGWTKKKTDKIYSAQFDISARDLLVVLHLAGIDLQFKII